MDDKYLNRCIKKLKSMGAPIEDWQCVGVIDVKEDDEDAPLADCDICNCDRVRYLHEMKNDNYEETLFVGCICAGVMEGDLLKAKERERLLRNRAKRRKRFISGNWTMSLAGRYRREYKGNQFFIERKNEKYIVTCNHKETSTYKGKPITNFMAAKYAAFELMDPVKAI